MTVALLAIGDGRHEYHARALRSALEQLPKLDHYVFVDDPSHELGFAGAIAEGWRLVLETSAQHVVHLELDFTLNGPLPVDDMVQVLTDRPYLTQLALFRQPWNDEERAAGSIYNVLRDDLTPADDGDGRRWLEHRRLFTTNPSVYPRWICERGWPQVRHSEGVFGGELLRSDDSLRSAYWGWGEELCEHIGDNRTGTGY